jgi:H+/gluconate symporter-like permease
MRWWVCFALLLLCFCSFTCNLTIACMHCLTTGDHCRYIAATDAVAGMAMMVVMVVEGACFFYDTNDFSLFVYLTLSLSLTHTHTHQHTHTHKHTSPVIADSLLIHRWWWW